MSNQQINDQSEKKAINLKISQTVSENKGEVSAIRTNNINGNVYGSGDIYQVQIYALSEAGPENLYQALKVHQPPYKFLQPYDLSDIHLYFGRQQDANEVLRKISIGQLVILYGQAGVGKTSLLATLVIPNLIKHGAFVVKVSDYTQPLGITIRDALNAQKDNIHLNLPSKDGLANIVRSLHNQLGGTLVLVLDQIERMFLPSVTSDLRLNLFNQVVESIKTVAAPKLRFVIAVRDVRFTPLLADLNMALDQGQPMFKELKPLSRKQAEEAIVEPVKLVERQITYDAELVKETLIPELDKLSPGEGEGIHPPYLQIVCYRLYEEVVENDRQVSKQLYVDKLRGAEGILASYLDKILSQDLTDIRKVTLRVLTSLASSRDSVYYSVDELKVAGVDPTQIEKVLWRLAETRLVERGWRGKQAVYALTS